MRVILFGFWGRRQNIAIQLPFIHRILDENPEVEFEAWNLSQRDESGADNRYIRGIPERARFTIRHDFYTNTRKTSRQQNEVWKHYASPKYQDAVFVKVDDDTIFLETNQFRRFTQAAAENPGVVISALTVNNGCSTRHIPAIWDIFTKLEPSLIDDDTPQPHLAKLLSVHRSADYADHCHRWLHNNWRTITGQPGKLIPTTDWLSINITAQTWDVVAHIAEHLAPHKSIPRVIAGRPQGANLGDEGASNILPRMIHTGFVAGHLTFGPQERTAAPGQVDEWRKMYTDIADQYLA